MERVSDLRTETKKTIIQASFHPVTQGQHIPAPDIIHQLVKRFEDHLDSYRSGYQFFQSADKARHDKLVSLVKRMLELHKQTPQEQEMLKREIESLDTRIDRLVYELYGLSEDEVRIVES